jgi:hypothetical protein
VTSGASNALVIYRLAGGAPLVFAAAAPPQQVAFVGTGGVRRKRQGCTVQRRRLDGTVVRSRVPRGSYNVTCANGGTPFARTAVVTPPLNEGAVAVLAPAETSASSGASHAAPHDACVAIAG